MALLVRHAQVVVGDPAVLGDFELMAEQGRPAELPHQRLGEVVEGVGQDDHLETLAQAVEELAGAFHGAHVADHRLDVLDFEPMLVEDLQPLRHQDVIVGDVAGRRPQGLDAGPFGDIDPDFGNQDTLEVKADDLHGVFLHQRLCAGYSRGTARRTMA